MNVTDEDREKAAELADRIETMGPAMTYRTLAQALAEARERGQAELTADLARSLGEGQP